MLGEVAIRTERVQSEPGATGATIKGHIKSEEIIDYQVRASAGPSMIVMPNTDRSSNYFTVTAQPRPVGRRRRAGVGRAP